MTWPFAQSTIDVIVGGLVAAVGGFLAVLWVRWRDDVAEDARFKAAVLVVLDELGANEVNLENLVGKLFGPLELHDATFRSVELILTARLSAVDRKLLAEAYAPVRSRWAAESQGGSAADSATLRQMNLIEPNQARLSAALAKIKSASRVRASGADRRGLNVRGYGGAG